MCANLHSRKGKAAAAALLLASTLQDASIIDSALALLHSKRSPNRRPAGLGRPPGPSLVWAHAACFGGLSWVYVGGLPQRLQTGLPPPRGVPLGRPPLTEEEVALVRAWRVTGMLE